MNYSFSSLTGKKVLALVRGGDYCHPGETEAIDLAFAGMAADANRLLLDVGCGAGGVAKYVYEHGLGKVVGVDIDRESIEYAGKLCPQAKFYISDVLNIGNILPANHFDVVYLFSSFYAFADKLAALRVLQKTAKAGAELMIFDYVDLGIDSAKTVNIMPYERYKDLPTVPKMEEFCALAGWHNFAFQDLQPKFEGWYAELVRRILQSREQIVTQFSEEWYDQALLVYRDGWLRAIREGYIGGGIFRAVK